MQLKQIETDNIRPNPFQPRNKFDNDELKDLADNIQKHGMIEPIVVTPKGEKYVIVAGERRWRAHKMLKKEKVWSLIKSYDSKAGIKRDSLVENVMRENLTNEEFRSFVFSLAKSLGEPYYVKGRVNASELSRYVLGTESDSVIWNTSFYKHVSALLSVYDKGHPQLKTALSEDKISLKTAEKISRIPDKKTQKEILDMAREKKDKEIRAEVARHRFKEEATRQREQTQKETNQEKIQKSETTLITRFANKLNTWNDTINYLSEHIKDNRNQFKKFTSESRLQLLDSLKPIKRDLERATHLVTKLMEELTK